ncbi:MAG: AGE family epimerase/isomerase [Planctomycetota bacterium]
MRNLLFLILVLVAAPLSAQDREQAAARRCQSVLRSSLVNFYLPDCVDQQHGGYLEELDEAGNFTTGEKFLTLQARQLWFFSLLAQNEIELESALDAAKSGYDFLLANFHDEQAGGFFTKTTADGTPSDRRKHVYPNAFVIYALVEYHRASGDAEALAHALDLFETLEKHCYDKQFGGYQEFFYDDWTPIRDPKESGYIGAINTKTYNSHLHLLEAFTELYEVTKNPLVGRRLSELILINTVTVKHPKLPCNIDGWTREWKMIESDRNLRASFGHDVECVWLVMEAMKALGRPTELIQDWGQSLCNYSIEHGYDNEYGGFCYTGPLNGKSDDRQKVWWTQAEAMVAMLTLFEMTGESRYLELFHQTFDFTDKHVVADKGSWWNTRNANGALSDNQSRTSMWQGGYHNGRALILCQEMLERISSQPK